MTRRPGLLATMLAAAVWPALAAATAGADQKPRELAVIQAHPQRIVFGLAFSPDGKTLASASQDKTVKLWDGAACRRGEVTSPLATVEGHTAWVRSVNFSPDGKTVVSGGRENAARLWDVATGKELAVLQGHTSWFYAVAYSPDGKTVASAEVNGIVRVWEVRPKE